MKKILKFYSKTCGPCKVMTNTLSQVEGAELREIDINDENSLSLMEKYNIRTIPTVIILNEDDSIKEVFKGIVPKESIENAIR